MVAVFLSSILSSNRRLWGIVLEIKLATFTVLFLLELNEVKEDQHQMGSSKRTTRVLLASILLLLLPLYFFIYPRDKFVISAAKNKRNTSHNSFRVIKERIKLNLLQNDRSMDADCSDRTTHFSSPSIISIPNPKH